MKTYSNVVLGKNCKVQDGVLLGLPSRDFLEKPESEWPKTSIGDNAVIRSGSIVYCDVAVGKNFQTGHHALIREKTTIGDRVLVGSHSIIEGNTSIGSNVSIQSFVFVPLNTVIEDKVFLGPRATLTNDKYPIRDKNFHKGPVIRKGASIGAGSVILPEVEIGEGAMVAAGAVVTKDVPAWTLAVGIPARHTKLSEKLRVLNLIGD